MHEDGAPLHVLVQQAAALVMRVVRIAVIGGAEGDDRLQRRRAQGRDLQRVEPAPGDPGHADRARTPVLFRQPGDYRDGVFMFLDGVFVI